MMDYFIGQLIMFTFKHKRLYFGPGLMMRQTTTLVAISCLVVTLVFLCAQRLQNMCVA